MGNSQPFPARWFRCLFQLSGVMLLPCQPARYLQCMMSRFRSRCQWNPREKEITTTWELYIQPAIRGLRHGSGTSFFENRYKKRRTTCDIGSDFSKSFDISHISKLYQKSHWRNQSRRRWCQNVNSQSYRHKVLPGSWYEKSPFFYLSQTNTTCINRKFQTFHPKNPLNTPGVFGSWHHLTELLLCSLGCLCKSTWCSQALQAASGTKKRLRTCVNRFPQ